MIEIERLEELIAPYWIEAGTSGFYACCEKYRRKNGQSAVVDEGELFLNKKASEIYRQFLLDTIEKLGLTSELKKLESSENE